MPACARERIFLTVTCFAVQGSSDMYGLAKVSLSIAHCDRLRYVSQSSLDIEETQVAGHLRAEPTYTVGIQPSLIRLCSTSR